MNERTYLTGKHSIRYYREQVNLTSNQVAAILDCSESVYRVFECKNNKTGAINSINIMAKAIVLLDANIDEILINANQSSRVRLRKLVSGVDSKELHDRLEQLKEGSGRWFNEYLKSLIMQCKTAEFRDACVSIKPKYVNKNIANVEKSSIKKYREQSGLNMANMAREIGCGYDTYRRLENENARCGAVTSPRVMARAIKRLNLDLDEVHMNVTDLRRTEVEYYLKLDDPNWKIKDVDASSTSKAYNKVKAVDCKEHNSTQKRETKIMNETNTSKEKHSVRYYREQLGLTRNQVAAILECEDDVYRVFEWKNDKKEIVNSLGIMAKAIRLFGVGVDDVSMKTTESGRKKIEYLAHDVDSEKLRDKARQLKERNGEWFEEYVRDLIKQNKTHEFREAFRGARWTKDDLENKDITEQHSIKYYRERSGLTRGEVVELIGCPRSSYDLFESANTSRAAAYSTYIMARALKLFGVGVDDVCMNVTDVIKIEIDYRLKIDQDDDMFDRLKQLISMDGTWYDRSKEKLLGIRATRGFKKLDSDENNTMREKESRVLDKVSVLKERHHIGFYRERLGLTKQQVASVIDYHYSNYTMFESKNAKTGEVLSIYTMAKVIRLFGIEIDDVYMTIDESKMADLIHLVNNMDITVIFDRLEQLKSRSGEWYEKYERELLIKGYTKELKIISGKSVKQIWSDKTGELNSKTGELNSKTTMSDKINYLCSKVADLEDKVKQLTRIINNETITRTDDNAVIVPDEEVNTYETKTLAWWRFELGASREELASVLRTSLFSYIRIENGELPIGRLALNRLTDLLGVSENDIVGLRKITN